MTTTRNTYTARAVRDGAWWAIDVPDVDGVYTQARRLDQVEAVAREAVALMLDLDPGSFVIAVDPTPGPPIDAEWRRVMQLREHAVEAERRAQEATLEIVRRFQEEGLPLRDIGLLLGVSHQRAGQLAHASAGRRAATAPSAPPAG